MSLHPEVKPSIQNTNAIKVLIADDDPPTRILLRAAISQWGYEVVEASHGEEAWEILQQSNPPRLLILDWLMPKLDGIALCERIKQAKILHPYTILLTQVTGTTNIIKGLEAGADEFLSKPFNMAELRSRLSVGARIITFEKALAEQNSKVENYATHMEALSQTHAKELVYRSDLLSMLGSLIESISQDTDDHFSKIFKDHQELLTKTSSNSLEKIENLRTHLKNTITIIHRLQNNSITSPKTAACHINHIIKNVLELSESAIKNINVRLDLANHLPPISADPDQLQEIFLSLILNAIEAMKDQKQASLNIQSKSTDKKYIQIIMEDTGPHISDAEIKALLQPQLISSNTLKQVHSRLSTAMSKDLMQKYGGHCSLENCSSGVRITLSFPLQI